MTERPFIAEFDFRYFEFRKSSIFILFDKTLSSKKNDTKIIEIDEFGISFAHASVRGHSTKQAFSAAELAREEYFFCGPSQGMFLLIPCSSLMTSEISHGALLTARFRTRLLAE